MIRPSRLRAGAAFADLAAQSQQPYGLTAVQRAIVGAHYPEQVLVVQGPPGTGKSHTLGLAILARAWALQSVARPFRVAVAAKTHAAVRSVLDSVLRRLQELLASHGHEERFDLLQHVRIADSTGFCGWWNACRTTMGLGPLMPPYGGERNPTPAEAQEDHPWAISISVGRLRVQGSIARMATPRHRIGSLWPRGGVSPRHCFRKIGPRVFPCTPATGRSHQTGAGAGSHGAPRGPS